jgi:hypothetical protein
MIMMMAVVAATPAILITATTGIVEALCVSALALTITVVITRLEFEAIVLAVVIVRVIVGITTIQSVANLGGSGGRP